MDRPTFVLDRPHTASRVLRRDVVIAARPFWSSSKGLHLAHCCMYYILPIAELPEIVARHGLQLHLHADDCQVYISTSVEHIPQAVDRFTTCVADVNAWLTTNRLRLNASKTVLIWLGSSQLLDKVTCKEVLLLGTRVAISDSARDLGTCIIIDRELSLEAHMSLTAVCRTGYNQLRQLRSVVRSLSVHATKTLVQAFISRRLDYCNSLLYGIYDTIRYDTTR